MIKREIPNLLSILRMVLACWLPLVTGNQGLFLCIYLLIGITDIADGYIARRFGWKSRIGAFLDSLADAVFYLLLLCVLIRDFPQIISANYFWIGSVIVLKTASLIVSFFRFHKAVFIHTLANKALGLILFCTIPLLIFSLPPLFVSIVCILALLPAIEELLILLTCKLPDANRKSLFTE
jgi:phosphatidylglycerophosphate synthase